MYSYEWDAETGGFILNSSPLAFSKEPRPVYYQELDMLGFDKYWNYEKDDEYPYMWAEANNYWYRGRQVAKLKGGSLYTAPEIEILEAPEADELPLRFVDVSLMVEKNRLLLEALVQETIRKVYNTFIDFRDKVDVFYVAFSGGKDSVVALDIVSKALPHNEFKVLFGDTGMEFPDTYDVVESISEKCNNEGIAFFRAKSKLSNEQTWKSFGPPAVTNRWCCSVHKTSPQVMLLQKLANTNGVVGMAFTGVRGDESLSRSEYDDISSGGKHKGQYSCHPILEWNSAELFCYIYQEKLFINKAYKKGNTRAGCLVCPMSSGKHEYMKHSCYPNEVDTFTDYIQSTSGKTSYSKENMKDFIDKGFWKTRKSGRELNFGQDKHIVDIEKGKTTISVLDYNVRWKEWAKTIGKFIQVDDDNYSIDYKEKVYIINLQRDKNVVAFNFPNCENSKNDVKFLSLFRSVIVKSIYCINCGVCVAECTSGCISMDNGLKISDKCKHCYQCHEIHEHCLRYNSIRNRIGAEQKMSDTDKRYDRYYSFGTKQAWLDSFFSHRGAETFWNTDGDGMVANKKKEAFLNFAKDANLVVLDKSRKSKDYDKFTKYVPTDFAEKLFDLGEETDIVWAMILCNLAYTTQFKWFIKNISRDISTTPEQMKIMLEPIMESDLKGLGRRNIIDAFKTFLIKTPLGTNIGLGDCDYKEKVSANGTETITLNSFVRKSWVNPEPKVVLYSLYKFAEACGDYYQFTLSRLLDHSIDSDGVSPTEIFGLEREEMEKILNGLTVNYPDFIHASFTLGLDNITLREDKTSTDVLALF